MSRLVAAVGAHWSQPLFRSAYSLMAGTVITSVLGVAYWVVAAQTHPPEVVGRDAALLASMTALSIIAQLNFADALPRFLPQVGTSAHRAVLGAYVISGGAAVILAASFVLIAPIVSDEFRFFSEPTLAVTYVLATVAWGVFSLQDATLAALQRATLVPVENAAFGVLKIAALPILAGVGAVHGVFLAWVLPVLALIPPIGYVLFRTAIPQHVARQALRSDRPRMPNRGRLVRFLTLDYLASAAGQAIVFVLPLLVVGFLGSRANAYFWVPFTLVLSFDLLLHNVVTSLTVEATSSGGRPDELVRAAVSRLLAPLVVASLAVIAAGPLLLTPFGPDYVKEGGPVLRILACAVVARAVLYVFAAMCRLRARAGPVLMLQVALLAGVLGLTALLAPHLGLQGVALAWLGTNAILAIVTAPFVLAVVRADTPKAEARQRRTPTRARGAGSDTSRRRRRPTWAGGVVQKTLTVATVVACVGAPVLVAAHAPAVLTAGMVLTLFCVAPGTALIAGLQRNQTSWEPGLILGASLATSTLAAQSMLWLDAWKPETWLVLLAGGSLTMLLLASGRSVARARRLAASTSAAPPQPPVDTRASRARTRAAGQRDSKDGGGFRPVWVTQVELAEPLSDRAVPARNGGEPYSEARVLIRLHGHPLGWVTLPLTNGTLQAESLLLSVDTELQKKPLTAHLAIDGLVSWHPSVDGLPAVGRPPCTAAGPLSAGCEPVDPQRAAFHAKPFVSIIICTRDRAASLRRTLETIRALDYGAFELIVVDNAPATDATERVIRELGDGRVRYFVEPRPGLPCAHNRGVEEVVGEIVAFTDDDVLVDDQWLNSIVRGFTRAPHVGCVTGLVPGAELETRAQAFFESRVRWGSQWERRIYDLAEHRVRDRLYPYDAGRFGAGANFALSRATLQAVGPFDEALGPGLPTEGGEDLDYFLRVLLSGRAIAYEPSALVWHVHRREDAALVRQMYGYGAGLSAYLFKHLISRRTGFDMARKVIGGVVHLRALSRGARQAVPAPAGAAWTEIRGLVLGPLAYLKGRRLARDHSAPPPPQRLSGTASLDASSEWGEAGGDDRKPSFAPVLLLPLLAGLGLWILSLTRADISRTAGFGLVDALPPTYFAGLALILGGFALGVTRRQPSSKLLWLYVVGLIVVLHGTTPLLYDEPRYAWTYKHLGVIDRIEATGRVGRWVDIYNNWPGFFAVNAWLSDLSGLAARSYAEWAQVFFNLANVVVVRFALRGVTSSARVIWIATWIFVLGNWIGMDYLAPQAFAFVLSMVVLGLCLRCAPAARPARSRLGQWLRGRQARLQFTLTRGAQVEKPAASAPLSPGAALVVGGGCYLAVVLSHQLSPVMLILSVSVLALLVGRVPLWVPAAMTLIELWWLLLALPFLKEYALFDPGLFLPTETPSDAPPLPGQAIAAWGGTAEMAILLALALIGVARRLQSGHWDVAAACLVAAPVFSLALQSYNGEGVYRSYLFSLPFVAFFVAAALLPPSALRRPIGGALRLGGAAGVLATCFLGAYFGPELADRIDTDDVQAVMWYERHAPTGSDAVFVAPWVPAPQTARYRLTYSSPFNVLSEEPYWQSNPSAARAVDYIRARHLRRPYVVITGNQRRYIRLFGTLRSGSLKRFERDLRASPDFRLVYQRGQARIFIYVRERVTR